MIDEVASLVQRVGYEGASLVIATQAVDNLDHVYVAGDLYLSHIESQSLDQRELLKKYKYRFTRSTLKFMEDNYDELSSMIVRERSRGYKYSSIKDLASNYLIKDNNVVVEDMQWMWMRVAVQVAYPSMEDIRDTYNGLSLREFVHATPTCVNACLRSNNEDRSQQESCFLVPMGDSMREIADTQKLFMMGSKNNGGFGIDLGRIRHSQVANRGTTKGIPGLLQYWNYLVPYPDQLGSRPAAVTMFFPIHHMDTPTILRMKDKNSSIQATNLNYAVVIPDLFMKRMKEGGKWSLTCPRKERKLWTRMHGGDDRDSLLVDKSPCLHELHGEDFEKFYLRCEESGIAEEVVDARELWHKINVARSTFGAPFIVFKDNVNRKSNHIHIGTITQSNLCVRGDTLLLTDKGNIPIKDLAEKEEDVSIWNGEEWSTVRPAKTGDSEHLLKVSFSNGSVIHCTDYHRFPIQKDEGEGHVMMSAQDLKEGHCLIEWNTIDGDTTSAIVTSIEDEGEYAETYCFTERQRNMGIFNDVLAINCMEILQYTSPQEGISASCDLATINLPSYLQPNGQIDWEGLGKVTRLITRNLNRVIDRTSGIMPNEGQRLLEIDIHMDSPLAPYVEKDPAHTGRMAHRAIGIGAMGYASLLSLMELEYGSDRAQHIGICIRACIYWHALDESVTLAQVEGPCKSWIGSPLSKGILHNDLYREECRKLGRKIFTKIDPIEFGVDKSWNYLRNKAKMGARNSLLTCQMPNSTTASVLGVSPGFEPFFDILYSSSNINGASMNVYDSFITVMKRYNLYDPVLLAKHLKENRGSLGDLKEVFPSAEPETISHIKNIFKNGFSINKKKMLLFYQKMGVYVDMAQSTNIFSAKPNAEYLGEITVTAWENGCKTLYYLHRRTIEKISLQSSKSDSPMADVKEEEADVCPIDCTSCQ
jgi:ribonucleotide reductase alpha subunit